MLRFFILLAAMLCSPAAASAQNLGDVINLIGGAQNVSSRVSYNYCNYRAGVDKRLCETQRLLGITESVTSTKRRFDNARRRDATQLDLRDSRPDLTIRLGQLCQRGDRGACNAVREMRRNDRANERQAHTPAQSEPRRFQRVDLPNSSSQPVLPPSPEAIAQCNAGDAYACRIVAARTGR